LKYPATELLHRHAKSKLRRANSFLSFRLQKTRINREIIVAPTDLEPKHNFTFGFKPTIVLLILNRQTEQALELLAKNYQVDTPKLKIGLPKGHKSRTYGTYTAKNQTISLLNSDMLGKPFVVLHEFSHHLRSKAIDKMHRGTEKNADKFAIEFIEEYQQAAKAFNAHHSS